MLFVKVGNVEKNKEKFKLEAIPQSPACFSPVLYNYTKLRSSFSLSLDSIFNILWAVLHVEKPYSIL
jgi:hypothetical protein